MNPNTSVSETASFRGAKQNVPDSNESLGRLSNSHPPKSAQKQHTESVGEREWPEWAKEEPVCQCGSGTLVTRITTTSELPDGPLSRSLGGRILESWIVDRRDFGRWME